MQLYLEGQVSGSKKPAEEYEAIRGETRASGGMTGGTEWVPNGRDGSVVS